MILGLLTITGVGILILGLYLILISTVGAAETNYGWFGPADESVLVLGALVALMGAILFLVSLAMKPKSVSHEQGPSLP